VRYNTLYDYHTFDQENTKLKTIIHNALLILFLVTEIFSQDVEYAYGTNYSIQIGATGSLLHQNKSRAGQGKNQVAGSTFIDASYTKLRYKSIWENYLNLASGLVKQEGEPLKKGQDYITISSHYGITTSYSSPWYTAADILIKTQMLPGYTGGYITNFNDSLLPETKFLAPLISEFSLGQEFRFPQSPIFIFGGVATNILYLKDDQIASYIVRDNKGMSLGTFYGNDPTRKVLIQAGLTAKARFKSFVIKDKLRYETYFRFFIDLLNRETSFSNTNSPIDIEWNNSIDFYLYKGINISLKVNLFFDKDMIFVENNKTGGSSFSKEGSSITSNLVIALRRNFNKNENN
jgi:hypothetical protein